MHYSDLRIYQIALQLASEVKILVKKIPRYWLIKEVIQVLRSSDAVPSIIVEGWNRRFYPKDYLRYLTMSLAESDESQTHLIALKNGNFIMDDESEHYQKAYKDLSIRILNMINYQKEKHNITI